MGAVQESISASSRRRKGGRDKVASPGVHQHPAWFFIKYVVLSTDEPTLDNLNATLRLHGVAPASIECLNAAVAELGLLPEDFFLGSTTHPATTRYLREQRVYSLFYPDEPTPEMRDSILADPRLRVTLDTLLLGRVSAKEASFRLRKHHKLIISSLAVEEYRHYFWNTTRLSVTDWADYFELDIQGRTGSSAVQNLLKTALVSGPSVAMHRVGIPRAIDNQRIFAELQAELYHTFLEVRQLPVSSHKVAMLKDLTGSLSRVDERMQAGDTALQDILKRFDQFKVVPKDDRVPTLAQIAPTGSVSKQKAKE